MFFKSKNVTKLVENEEVQESEEIDDIFDMELNDIADVATDLQVRRVPGGWLYLEYQSGNALAPVFVPYNEEFKK